MTWINPDVEGLTPEPTAAASCLQGFQAFSSKYRRHVLRDAAIARVSCI